MFFIKEPSSLGSPWMLSRYDDKQIVAISKDIIKDLKNHHILGIDFLYKNYVKQFKGAILNEEDGMNMQLQVAAFLNAVFNSVPPKFLILIISPDDLLIRWHYHLTIHGGFKVKIVTSNTCPEDFDEEHGLALLLSFSNIKLAEYLIDYDYFSIIIDNFDEVASKLIIRKLNSRFNIGLTQRSFYLNPNQKLQWTMLNWSNPGCVGKLADFYEIDNDNFANFRDNYRHWWFRLTWDFCESFRKITLKGKQEYIGSLAKWAVANHLTNGPSVKIGIKVKKRKQDEIIQDIKEDNTDEQKNKVVKIEYKRKIYNKLDAKGDCLEIIYDKFKEKSQNSSQDTISHEALDLLVKDRGPNYVDLPSMDENPILNSIIRNLEKFPEPVITHHPPYSFTTTKLDLEQPNCSKAFEDDVLMSIIDDTDSAPSRPPLDHETQVSYKKEELLSQIFNEDPCSSRSFMQTEEDTSFFQSLVGSDNSNNVTKGNGMKYSKSEDIDDILKETEVLLRE